MKKLFLILFLVEPFALIHAQISLTITDAPWSYSKKCIERTIPNFISIMEMSPQNFENEMKRIGASVRVGQNYCIVASEQLGSGATLNAPALIFNKCDDLLSVDWYGPINSPAVFMNIMEDIKNHHLQTIDGIRYYGLKYNEKEYTFGFKRVQENNTMFETMTIWKVKR